MQLRGFQPGAKASRALPVLACLPAPVGGKPWQEAQAASARLQGVLAASLAALAVLGLLLALAASGPVGRPAGAAGPAAHTVAPVA